MAWFGLVALTLVSFAAAEGLVSHRIAVVGIFAIAAIKGQIVASRFMEVGHALPHWRTLYRVWIAGIAVLLATGHLL
jgi:heme/copper-type cytochrome/quinol oxidase subunit 4